MKRIVLVLIILVVFSISAYAQKCKCDNHHAITWAKKQIYYGGDSSDFNDYLDYVEAGDKLLEKKQYQAAIKEYRKAIEIESCLPEPYAGIAWCYEKLLNKYLALEYYRIRAIESNVMKCQISTSGAISTTISARRFWATDAEAELKSMRPFKDV